jgi:hypothetical protein
MTPATAQTNTPVTRAEYDRLVEERRRIISFNAGQRLARNPLPLRTVPPAPSKPQQVQLSDRAGNYIGTLPVGVSIEEAKAAAAEAGEPGPYRVKLIDATNW